MDARGGGGILSRGGLLCAGALATPVAPRHPRFDIVRALGEGGYGTVFEAFDRERGERVALKRLHRTTPRAMSAFKREFRTLSGLVHAGLPRLHELFVQGDESFFSMELVTGDDLRSQIHGDDGLSEIASLTRTGELRDGGQAPVAVIAPSVLDDVALQRARTIVDALLDVLAFVHRSGLVHCDVKPSNVRVTPAGRVVLLDFGLARPLMEATGGFVGTPAYAAPEQVAGQVSPAADLYALGALGYEMLAGNPPFGRGQDAVENKQRRDAQPLKLASAQHQDLVRLLMGLLSRDPEGRVAALAAYRRGGTEGHASVAPEHIVGREHVLAQITQALESVYQGSAVVLAIEGASGMGKTTVLREAARRLHAATPPVVVLRGRAAEGEHLPWNLFDGVVDDLAERLGPGGRSVAPVLGRAFPVLREHAVQATEQDTDADVAPALRRALAQLGPAVLLLDDAQWADADSRRLLAALLSPPAAPALLVVIATRPNPDLPRLLPTQAVHRIPLGPLSRADMFSLLSARVGETAVDAIARESGGHPLFIEELVRAEPEQRARSLEQVLRRRVALLDPLALMLLEVLALAREPLSARAVAAISRQDLADVTQTLDLLCQQRLARTSDDAHAVRYAPFHDRLAELLRVDLGAASASERHEDFVRWYQEMDGAAESLCHHLRGAGRPEDAGRYALLSADRARSAMAFEREARFCEIALSLLRVEPVVARALRLRRAEALRKARLSVSAADEFQSLADDESEPRARELRTLAARLYFGAGELARGQAILTSLLARSGDVLPKTYADAALALLRERALLRVELALPLALRGAPDPERLPALRAIAEGLGMIDTLRAAVFHARAVRVAIRSPDPSVRAELMAIESIFLGNAHRKGRREARRLLALAVEPFGARVPARIAGFVDAAVAMNERSQHPSHRNLERFKRAEAFFESLGEGDAWVVWSLRLSRARGARILGDLNEMRAFYYPALAEAEQQQDAYARVTLLRANTILLLAADEPARARQVLDETHWPGSPNAYHIQDWLDLEARLEASLYEGRPLPLTSKQWRRLWRSALHYGDTQRSVHWYMRGRLLLIQPRSLVSDARVRVEVERTVRRLVSQREGYALAMARALRAGLFARHQAWDLALRELRAVRRLAHRYELLSLGANASLLIGLLAQGPERQEAATQAAHFYDAHAVRRPHAWASIDFPSFRPILTGAPGQHPL